MCQNNEVNLSLREVKVALIHAEVHWKDKENNVLNLLKLNEEAAKAGARIIVNPELATSGYAFENRADIATLTETIPGPTTRSFGEIAKKYNSYICIALPEVDDKTEIFYNSAAVLGPEGNVLGKHRKISPAFKENLWAARGNLPVLVVETRFGKIGLVICADAYCYKTVRIAALKGADLLLMPVNWPADYNNPEVYWRARAIENGVYILVCNRTGVDNGMDCRSGESFVIDNQGEIIKKVSSPENAIVYGEVPLKKGQFISSARNMLKQRCPETYSNISISPYSSFGTESLLNLPPAGDITAAVIQYQPVLNKPGLNLENVLGLIDKALNKAQSLGRKIDLFIFPELSTTGIISEYDQAQKWSEEIPGPITEKIKQKAETTGTYIVIGMAENRGGKFYNSSVLIGPGEILGIYRKVHLSSYDKGWAEKGNNFSVFDLPFARVGMLIGNDLLFPEAAESMSKSGADLICLPCFWEDQNSSFLWKARMAEQVHLAVANQWGGKYNAIGRSTIYSYCLDPDQRQKSESPQENNHINLMKLKIKNARQKKFLENIDYDILLDLERGDIE